MNFRFGSRQGPSGFAWLTYSKDNARSAEWCVLDRRKALTVNTTKEADEDILDIKVTIPRSPAFSSTNPYVIVRNKRSIG